MLVHETQPHASHLAEASNANTCPTWKTKWQHSLKNYVKILEVRLAILEKKQNPEGETLKNESNKEEEKAQEPNHCSPTLLQVNMLPSSIGAENIEGTSMGNSVTHSSKVKRYIFHLAQASNLCKFYATSNVIVKCFIHNYYGQASWS